jgi:hypothetical protein
MRRIDCTIVHTIYFFGLCERTVGRSADVWAGSAQLVYALFCMGFASVSRYRLTTRRAQRCFWRVRWFWKRKKLPNPLRSLSLLLTCIHENTNKLTLTATIYHSKLFTQSSVISGRTLNEQLIQQRRLTSSSSNPEGNDQRRPTDTKSSESEHAGHIPRSR